MKKLLMLSTVLVLTSCAGSKEPSFGEMIQIESAATKSLGDDWLKGDELITKGSDLIKDGQKDVAKAKKLDRKGQDKIEKGEDYITRGKTMKENAERQYKSVTAPPQTANSSLNQGTTTEGGVVYEPY